MTEHLSKESFKQKVFNFEEHKDWKFAGDVPCIIDFYADWCGPCKMVAPIFEELSNEYQGKLNIYKVDTEEQPELASLFGISSIPTILFVPKEDLPRLSVGAQSKGELKGIIQDFLKVH
jgi:thioredoxin